VVHGIGDGTLDEGRFRRWLVQDYLFLLDYVRLFALAAARAPDAGTLGRLVDLAHATFHDELSLHRAYAARAGRRLRARVPHQPGPRAGVLGRLTGRVRVARRR
jgi:thiaminase (transcriptional activator TenA)